MEKKSVFSVPLKSCWDWYSCVIPYGRIMYVKCKDNVVRECKVIGGSCDENGFVYEIKVAGIETPVCFHYNDMKTEIGVVYETMECAKSGSSNRYSYSKRGGADVSIPINIKSMIMSAYPNLPSNFIHRGYSTLNPAIEVDLYALYTDGDVSLTRTKICLYMDESGWHIELPELDKGIRYVDTYSATNRVKVVSFGDEEEREPEDEILELNIKVSKSKLEELRKIGIEI